MRIFVTGATGFIGAHFVEQALTAGHQVRGIYRTRRPELSTLLNHLRGLGAELHRGDILEPATFDSQLNGIDCVVHFAAAFREADATTRVFHRSNGEGTENLLDSAREHGVRRFVLCSTAGIYGRCVRGVIDERARPRPFNDYEQSKLNAEAVVRDEAAVSGMEYVILRPAVVYGPRDERLRKLFDGVVKGRFPLFGKGEGRRHMVYVTDVAEAFLLACVEPAAAGQELIIAGPEAVPLRVMLQTLAQLVNRRRCGPTLPLKPMLKLAAVTEDVCHHFGLRPPIYRRRMDFYLNDAAFDCRRAQAVLGWKPKVDLREGLANTLRTYDTEQVTDVWNSWAGVSVQAMVAAEALETGSRLVS